MNLRNATGIFAAALTVAGFTAVNAQAVKTGPRHTITEICTGGECVWEKVATCSGFLEGINVAKDGTIYMVGYFEGQIYKVENGACVPVGPASGAPNGAKLAPDGGMLIADRVGGIMRADLETGERTSVHPAFGVVNFRGLNDLVFDSEGGYYFTEPYGSDALNPVGKVYYVAPGEGSRPQVYLENIAYPNGIAVSANGQQIYVSEFGKNRVLSAPSVHSKNPFDSPLVFARFEGGIGPDGLAVDAAGNVYVAHFNAGEIVVIDPQGFHYGVLPLPEGAGPFTTNVAIRDGYMYVTEAAKNELWKMPVNAQALD